MIFPLFRVSGLCFSYDADLPIIKNADFELWPGERVALKGTNGAGKTTLLHLMVGLQRPSAGSIEVFGKRRQSEKDFYEVRARVGLLFQDPDDQLFCPTVIEDVAFGPLNLGKKSAEALVIARQTLDMLGLGMLEGRVTSKLSWGQKRLVSLAAILAMKPEVLLLDEPTNALDTCSRMQLLSIIASLPQAMVVITHNDDELMALLSRQINLENGQLRQTNAAFA